MGDGGADDPVDLGRVQPGAIHGLARCGHRHEQGSFLISRPATLLDTGALLDPLRGGIDDGAHLLVVDDSRTTVATNTQNAGVAATGGGDQCHVAAFRAVR